MEILDKRPISTEVIFNILEITKEKIRDNINIEAILHETTKDLEASQKIVKWITHEVILCSEKILSNENKVFKLINQNKIEIAKEILIVNEVLKIIINKLKLISNRIINIRERIINIIEKIKKLNKKFYLSEKEMKDEKIIKRKIREIATFLLYLVDLNKYLIKMNKNIDLARTLIEDLREIMEKSMLDKKIMKYCNEKMLERIERKLKQY